MTERLFEPTDPQLVVRTLSVLASVTDRDDLFRAQAALPHAERIAALWPLYEELEATTREAHHKFEAWPGKMAACTCGKQLEACAEASALQRIEEAKS